MNQNAEKKRQHVEKQLHTIAQEALSDTVDDWKARLQLSIAAAHLGFASIKTAPSEVHERRFALAYAVAALARWFKLSE